MENTERNSRLGGFREGAGRKKELPDGAKVTSFKLTDTERIAVKKFIAGLRGGGNSKLKEAEKEKIAFEIGRKATKPLALALRKIVDLYGGRGKGNGFRKAEEAAKFIAIVATKDAIQLWESDNPRQYDENGKEIR